MCRWLPHVQFSMGQHHMVDFFDCFGRSDIDWACRSFDVTRACATTMKSNSPFFISSKNNVWWAHEIYYLYFPYCSWGCLFLLSVKLKLNRAGCSKFDSFQSTDGTWHKQCCFSSEIKKVRDLLTYSRSLLITDHKMSGLSCWFHPLLRLHYKPMWLIKKAYLIAIGCVPKLKMTVCMIARHDRKRW